MPACTTRPDSLRARHCVRGRRMLYEFCASHGVPHKKVGKLIVAVDEKQTAKIEGIAKQGEINGVEGLELIGANAARAMEPALNCVAALHSHETGIIDSHAFMLALEGDLEDRGGMIAFNTAIERLRLDDGRLGSPLRRRGGGHAHRRCGDQLGGPRRADNRARHRRLSAVARAAPRARQGQLLRLCRQAGVLAADLSGAGRGRARHACDARHGGPHALRPGRASGSRARATRSIRSARNRSMRACALISRRCRTIRSCRTIAASGRSSPARASRRPIS